LDLIVAKKEDRYCPNCLQKLNEGMVDWLWCPDTVKCKFECDVKKEDTSLSFKEFLIAKREQVRDSLTALRVEYDYEVSCLEAEITSLSKMIDHSDSQG